MKDHFNNRHANGTISQDGDSESIDDSQVFVPELKSRSVLSYFYSELTRGYLLQHDEAKYTEKRRRIYTFMKIPRELEKFMTYGFFQCLDAFLYVFTFLPIRFTVGLLKFFIKGTISSCISQPGRVLEPAQICDLLKGFIVLSCYFMMQYVDVSMMYHLIRGQAIIKLYLFFNMLEVADRLFASFGQDILDALFWTATEPPGRRREHFRLLPHLLLAVVYVFGHGVLILFQATTLNVAFNSHNKALLTIMMSNNFVELKGSVFKKFEKNNLFQMSCSDVRERFHFVVLLAIVCIRNLTEFSWDMAHFWVLIPDVIMIMASEFLVDWVKHAFITKFNEIPDEVYKEYTTSLAYDMVQTRQNKSHSDHLDMVSRRMGFTPLPLAVILMRIVGQSFNIQTSKAWVLVFMFYICLVTFKVLNSIILLGKACYYTQQTKKKSSPSSSSTSISSQNISNNAEDVFNTKINRHPKRRCSDPSLNFTIGVEDIIKQSCMKRSTSVSGKLNVTFSDCEDSDIMKQSNIKKLDGSISMDESIQSQPLTPKLLFSNSTVSLQSVGLNDEFVKDSKADSSESNVIEETKVIKGANLPEVSSEVKNRKTPTPLNEIDRYTMCSNRII